LTVSSGDHYDLSGLFRFSSLSSYNPPVNVKTFVRWWSVIVGKDVFIISVPISLCIECILSARMLCKLVTRENCDESQSLWNQLVSNGYIGLSAPYQHKELEGVWIPLVP
jgi:hypothetical protein